MKLLYTLIILFAFSFAEDTGVLFFSPDETINIVFEKIEDGYVQYSEYKNDKKYFKSIEVEKVYALYLHNGTEIISPHKTTKAQIDNPMKLDGRKESKELIGGLLIAAGGAFLFSNLHKEPNRDETLEEFADRLKGTAELGYGLIIIGGVLVAMGI